MVTFEQLYIKWERASQTLFPKADAKASLRQAIKEIKEVEELLDTDIPFPEYELTEEYADVIIAVLSSAIRCGIDHEAMVASISRKMLKNERRKWKLNEDNTYSHIKE